MNNDKKRLIYSMLLNIQENIKNIVESFDIENPEWCKIYDLLNESEAETVYILENIKDLIVQNK